MEVFIILALDLTVCTTLTYVMWCRPLMPCKVISKKAFTIPYGGMAGVTGIASLEPGVEHC
jgi:hypothetical protein